jgi:hypothetical protein
MSDNYTVSRRASLKSLAVMGVGMASGMAAEASAPPAGRVSVDLAGARMTMEQRHSCAQAVFSAFAEPMGIDHETAIKLSSGFGGGCTWEARVGR